MRKETDIQFQEVQKCSNKMTKYNLIIFKPNILRDKEGHYIMTK